MSSLDQEPNEELSCHFQTQVEGEVAGSDTPPIIDHSTQAFSGAAALRDRAACLVCSVICCSAVLFARRPTTLLIWNNEKNQDAGAGLRGNAGPVPQTYAAQLKVMKRWQPSSTSRSPGNLIGYAGRCKCKRVCLLLEKICDA